MTFKCKRHDTRSKIYKTKQSVILHLIHHPLLLASSVIIIIKLLQTCSVSGTDSHTQGLLLLALLHTHIIISSKRPVM